MEIPAFIIDTLSRMMADISSGRPVSDNDQVVIQSWIEFGIGGDNAIEYETMAKVIKGWYDSSKRRF